MNGKCPICAKNKVLPNHVLCFHCQSIVTKKCIRCSQPRGQEDTYSDPYCEYCYIDVNTNFPTELSPFTILSTIQDEFPDIGTIKIYKRGLMCMMTLMQGTVNSEIIESIRVHIKKMEEWRRQMDMHQISKLTWEMSDTGFLIYVE